ncbi:kinase-like protein, partial [Thelephora ganbajun]
MTGRSSTSAKLRVQQLLDNPPSQESIRAEVQLVVDDGNIGVIRELGARDQARFLEIVDQAAPAVLAKDVKFLTALGDICSDTLLLPTSTGLLQGLVKRGETAVASGGTTDIWRGAWNDKPVALKAFRIYPLQDLQEAKKILWKLVPTWKRLAHENVLPFHGVDTSMFQLALVYEWGHNGNIMQYLESHPDASRPKLLLQVAEGLQYLHSFEIVHGSLKGANVLISKSGKAQICDYGLSPVMVNPIFTIAATPGVAGLSRRLAPEIIDPPSKTSFKPLVASKSADVFAFAMLAVEVFIGMGRGPPSHRLPSSLGLLRRCGNSSKSVGTRTRISDQLSMKSSIFGRGLSTGIGTTIAVQRQRDLDAALSLWNPLQPTEGNMESPRCVGSAFVVYF